MPAALVVLLTTLAAVGPPTGEGGDRVAAALARLTDDVEQPGDAAVYRRLAERADAWRNLRTQAESIPAAQALRTLADGAGPFAGPARAALDARREAILKDLRDRGVRRSRLGPRDGHPDDVNVRYRFEKPTPPGEPHALTRLQLLAPEGGPERRYVEQGFHAGDLTPAQLTQIAAVPGLRSLRFHRKEEPDAAWLEPLRGHPTLERVSFFATPIPPEGCAILATIPNLASVGLNGCRIGDAGRAALAKSKSLRSLGLSGAGITNAGLRDLAARGNLTDVSLANDPITDEGFRALPLRGVESLNLAGTKCGDGALEHMVGRWAPPRGDGKFRDGARVDLTGTQVTDAGLAHLAAAPRVGELTLNFTAVTGAGFAAWAEAGRRLPDRLSLYQTRLDDAGCAALARCSSPRSLNLDCRRVPAGPVGIARLADIPGLFNLDVGGPAFTDDSLAALAGAASLYTLSVADSPATGTGVAALAGTTGVNTLRFDDCPVTEAGLRAIAGLPEVKDVTVSGGNLTDGMWAILAEAPPMDQARFSGMPVAGPGLAEFAAYPARPILPGRAERVPLWAALTRVGWGHESLGDPRTWPRDLLRFAGPRLLATPTRSVPLALARMPRVVEPLADPAFRLELTAAGMTDDLLRSLPPLPVDDWVLGDDPISADAVLDFIARQPAARRLRVRGCPAAEGDGPARIAAALAARVARRRRGLVGAGTPAIPAGLVPYEAVGAGLHGLGERLLVGLGAESAAGRLAGAMELAANPGADPREAAAALRFLIERANDWRHLATQDRSIPAAAALRMVAAGRSPRAGAAAAALDRREAAILADLRGRGVAVTIFDRTVPRFREVDGDRVRNNLDEAGREPPRRVEVRITAARHGAGPHPIVRLRLLNLADAGVRIVHDAPSRSLTAAGFADLCATPGLTALEVRGEAVADAWLESLRRRPALRRVALPSRGIGVDGCATLAALPNLEEVELRSPNIGNAGLVALAASPSLRDFHLPYCRITDGGLAVLADRANLGRVALAGNPITDAGFVRLPLTGVVDLDLSDTRCGDGALERLRGRWAGGDGRTGAIVDLSGTAVTDAGLGYLTAAGPMLSLDLSATAATGRGFAAFEAAGRRLPLSIVLAGSAFDDAGCAALAACDGDGTLTLSCEDTPVTDAGLIVLGNSGRLSGLVVGGRAITDAGLAGLAGCRGLTALTVTAGPATGTGLAALAETTRLQRLEFHRPHRSATDAGLRAAATLPDLSSLIVHGGDLTDAIFAPLARMPALRRVELWDVPVGGPGLADLAPRSPAGDDFVTREVPLAVALRRPEFRRRAFRRPGALLREAGPALLAAGPTDPLFGLATASLTIRRTVEVPSVAPLTVELYSVGLTEDVLAGLPPLPITDLTLWGDPLGADAVAAFVQAQPHLRRVTVGGCPAATGDGPARIAAALADR